MLDLFEINLLLAVFVRYTPRVFGTSELIRGLMSGSPQVRGPS